MADDNGVPARTLRVVRSKATRRWDRSHTTAGLLARLDGADLLSLAALATAWVAALLFVAREPNWAIVATFGAAGFDKLDGYYARTYGEPTRFGRQLDSFVDVFVYLVTAGLLFHFAVAPSPVVSAVVGGSLVAFGVLRLLRHAEDGFGEEGEQSYYLGITVVHATVLVVANYYLLALVPAWNGWLAAATVAACGPAMVSGYKSYKTLAGHLLAGAGAATAVALALALEFGLLGGG